LHQTIIRCLAVRYVEDFSGENMCILWDIKIKDV